MSDINSNATRTPRSSREFSINKRRAFCRWVHLYKEGKLAPQDDDNYLSDEQNGDNTVTISSKKYEILLHTYFMFKEGLK